MGCSILTDHRRRSVSRICLPPNDEDICWTTHGDTMHILILHPENRHLGGAERMLEYFCAALPELNRRVTVAVAPKSRLQELLPKTIQMVEIPANGQFSLRGRSEEPRLNSSH